MILMEQNTNFIIIFSNNTHINESTNTLKPINIFFDENPVFAFDWIYKYIFVGNNSNIIITKMADLNTFT